MPLSRILPSEKVGIGKMQESNPITVYVGETTNELIVPQTDPRYGVLVCLVHIRVF